MNDNKAYLLYYCNRHKEKSTMQLTGVYTDKKELIKRINKELEGDVFEWIVSEKPDDATDDYTLINNLIYGNIKIIKLNKEI